MNILFDINHPAHVHFFRNAIHILKKNGHDITITSRDKDVTLDLLDQYNLPHICLSRAKPGFLRLACELICREYQLLGLILKKKIQICAAVTGACTTHVSKLLRIPALVFYDTEHAKLQNMITYPFATKIFTPFTYHGNLGERHIKYKGVKELSYLHPAYFRADPAVLDLLNLQRHEKFVILRFVSWEAAHDIGHPGLSFEFKKKLIDVISRYAKIFVTSEAPMEENFARYRFPLPSSKMLDALSFSTMYLGEGGTMATEAALLGTPSILISSQKAGVSQILNKDYGLIYPFHPNQESEIMHKIKEILEDTDSKKKWKDKKDNFLRESIDVTTFIVNAILSYELAKT